MTGTYAGVVEDNKDPERLGRLKIRVPHAYGAVGGVYGAITTENLPWALPAGLPNGLSQQSGGCDWLPEVGDQLLVRFLDGEPEKPVYEWFMQTQASAETFKLHQYAEAADGGVGKPKRGAWVRYGHTVEWNTDGLILTTSKGYRVLLTDSSPGAGLDGDITVATQAGQFLELDDSTNTVSLNANVDYQINVGGQMLALCDSISLQTMSAEIELISGSDFVFDTVNNTEGRIGGNWTMNVAGPVLHTFADNYQIDVTGEWIVTALAGLSFDVTGEIRLTTPAPITLQFSKLFLGPAATEPYVLGFQLINYLNQLHDALVSHTHAGVFPGSSVTTPMLPTPPAPTATLLSAIITGR